MQTSFKILFLLLLPFLGVAQSSSTSQAQTVPDSLRQILTTTDNDSIRYQACRLLYTHYEERNRDSALYYADQRLLLSRKNNKKIPEAFDLGVKGYQLVYLGRFGEALDCLLQGQKIAEDLRNDNQESWQLNNYPSPGKHRQVTLSMINHMFGHLMMQTHNVDKQLFYLKEGRRIALSIDNHFRVVVGDMVLGSSYNNLNQPDSALYYAREAEQFATKAGIKRYYGYIWFVMGDVFLKKKEKQTALEYYHKSLQSALQQQNLSTLVISYDRLIHYHLMAGNKDSVLLYALKNLHSMTILGAVTSTAALEINMGTAYEQVAIGYTLANQLDSAFRYQGLALATKDSLTEIKIKNLTDFQNQSLNEQLRLQHIEQEKVLYQNKIRAYAMLAGLVVFMLIAFLLYRNNRNRHKANLILKQQKEELQSTLSELKSTQSQLIQSEKMASLGELTAGIAHEIQNPLNFVNNFSDVNTELLDELTAEVEKGNLDEVKAIAKDIRDNEQKINRHGKRADAIVKGMLQHSRSSSGAKEPTDINALADEYLRLAYHGLRAKDKSFNAIMKTDFDASIGKVNVIPQDMGRVMLNLISNAFYAVSTMAPKSPKGDLPYTPIVTVTTKLIKSPSGDLGAKRDTGDLGAQRVQISISDNGPGIPASVLDKIFQPFFTTKPTGQGTGLGLSLSYDIVKAHGGELRVETKEGEGSVFTIQLPLS
jgi:two-component system NtrC family sensor kinase